jgi:hypothetical protein
VAALCPLSEVQICYETYEIKKVNYWTFPVVLLYTDYEPLLRSCYGNLVTGWTKEEFVDFRRPSCLFFINLTTNLPTSEVKNGFSHILPFIHP